MRLNYLDSEFNHSVFMGKCLILLVIKVIKSIHVFNNGFSGPQTALFFSSNISRSKVKLHMHSTYIFSIFRLYFYSKKDLFGSARFLVNFVHLKVDKIILGIPFSILITHLMLLSNKWYQVYQDLCFSHILPAKYPWYCKAKFSLTDVECVLKRET